VLRQPRSAVASHITARSSRSLSTPCLERGDRPRSRLQAFQNAHSGLCRQNIVVRSLVFGSNVKILCKRGWGRATIAARQKLRPARQKCAQKTPICPLGSHTTTAMRRRLSRHDGTAPRLIKAAPLRLPRAGLLPAIFKPQADAIRIGTPTLDRPFSAAPRRYLHGGSLRRRRSTAVGCVIWPQASELSSGGCRQSADRPPARPTADQSATRSR